MKLELGVEVAEVEEVEAGELKVEEEERKEVEEAEMEVEEGTKNLRLSQTGGFDLNPQV